MTHVVIPFSLTAAEVNTLDTAPVTIASISNDKVLYVPKLLKLFKEAGTAYSISRVPTRPRSSDSYVADDQPVVDYFRAAHELIIYDTMGAKITGREERGDLLFRIPMFDFLDQATEERRIVLPEAGIVVEPGVRTIVIESLTSIASGTGVLRGELHFDEIGV